MLQSRLPELVHRVLVSISEACSMELQFNEREYAEYMQQIQQQETSLSTSATGVVGTVGGGGVKSSDVAITQHFIDNGVLPAIAVVVQLKDPKLGECQCE